MASAIIVDKGFPFMEGYRFFPVFPKPAWWYDCITDCTTLQPLSTIFPQFSFYQDTQAFNNTTNKMNCCSIARLLRLIAYWGPIFGYANMTRKYNFWKGTLTVCPASLFFSSRNHHYNFHAKFFRYKCRFQTYRAIFPSRNIYQVRVKTIRSRNTFSDCIIQLL